MRNKLLSAILATGLFGLAGASYADPAVVHHHRHRVHHRVVHHKVHHRKVHHRPAP